MLPTTDKDAVTSSFGEEWQSAGETFNNTVPRVLDNFIQALPAVLLRTVLSFASVRTLARLAATNHAAASAVDLHGEALLQQMVALATTNRRALLTGKLIRN